jgi:hypothetical protein
MIFPQPDEYNNAVQNPKTCFSDDELRSGRVHQNAMGLPFAYSGGFTTTYKIFTDNTTYAARCFIRDVRNLIARYDAISDFRLRSKCPYLVDADVLKKGILVGGKWHPIIKMRWVEGDLFNVYLEKLLSRDQLERVGFLATFEEFAHQLEKDEFAHGDLQHGNIIINNHKIRLIDYDGIYLPEIEALGTGEVGHPNYQHPGRTTKYFDRNLDRFSVIVIWLSIKALVYKPDLWKKYNNGENLIFRRDDFRTPEDSELLYKLSKISELTDDVLKLVAVSRGKFEGIPSLKKFIDGSFSHNKVILNKPAKTAETITTKEQDVFNKLYGAPTSSVAQKSSGAFHYAPTTTLSGGAGGLPPVIQLPSRPAQNKPQPVRAKTSNWAWWLIGAVALFVIIGISSNNSNTTQTPTPPPPAPPQSQPLPTSCTSSQCKLSDGTCVDKPANSFCNPDATTAYNSWKCNSGYYQVSLKNGGDGCFNADDLNAGCNTSQTNSRWDENDPKGESYLCRCPLGYTDNGIPFNSPGSACVPPTNDQICQDQHGANSYFTNNNSQGGVNCGCASGYTMNNGQCESNDQICQDEYGANSDYSGSKNSTGGLVCGCANGYAWNTGHTACVVVAPSLSNDQLCDQKFHNSYATPDPSTAVGFSCACKTGYYWDNQTPGQSGNCFTTAQLNQACNNNNPGTHWSGTHDSNGIYTCIY